MIKINLLTENPALLRKCRNPILLVSTNGVVLVTEDPKIRLLMFENNNVELFAKTVTRTLLIIFGADIVVKSDVSVSISTIRDDFKLQKMMIDWDPLEATIRFSTDLVPSPENHIVQVTKDLEMHIFIKS